jgi:hypothetical protein
VVHVNEVTGGVRAPEEDGEVPGFWRELGMPRLADIHRHFLPPRMLRRVWEYFDAAGRESPRRAIQFAGSRGEDIGFPRR